MPRAQLESWLQLNCRALLAAVDGATMLDLLVQHTFGELALQTKADLLADGQCCQLLPCGVCVCMHSRQMHQGALDLPAWLGAAAIR